VGVEVAGLEGQMNWLLIGQVAGMCLIGAGVVVLVIVKLGRRR